MTRAPDAHDIEVASSEPGFHKGLLDHISDGVYFVDNERRILYWNSGAERLTGYEAQEILGRQCQDDILCHVDYEGKRLCQDGCPLTASIADGRERSADVFLRQKQGRLVPVNVRVQSIRDAAGTIVGAIEIFSDNTVRNEERRKLIALNRLAFLDHLTQLPNRRYLEMSLNSALSEFAVHKDPFGVLLIDVDEFKQINDNHGHNFGDRALQLVAGTLVSSLRPNSDIIGRWGGDEFLAIVHSVSRSTLRDLAARCVKMTARTSIKCDDERVISVPVSIGATLACLGESAEELISRVDKLMYESKSGGRGRATVE